MTLTRREFLNLAAVIKNLYETLYNFEIERNDIKEFNRRVSKTAQKYFDFFREARYMEFINLIRISYI